MFLSEKTKCHDLCVLFLKPSTILKYFQIFLVFLQTFFAPQVKRSVIVNNKNGIYELPDKLPGNLKVH